MSQVGQSSGWLSSVNSIMPACDLATTSEVAAVLICMPSVASMVQAAIGLGNQKILGWAASPSPSMMKLPSGFLRGLPDSIRHIRHAPTGER